MTGVLSCDGEAVNGLRESNFSVAPNKMLLSLCRCMPWHAAFDGNLVVMVV